MIYEFSELINVQQLQTLTDSFYEATQVTSAIVDLKGEILTGSGWQPICTQFHRAHPQTCQRCIESDTALSQWALNNKKYAIYECHNGLVDVAMPIFLEEEHVANLFIGQFLFEEPDIQFFIKQAQEFNFEQSSYLAALAQVPIVDKNRIPSIANFLTQLANLIGEMGLTQKRQMDYLDKLEIRVEDRTKELKQKLEYIQYQKTEQQKFMALVENSKDFIAMADLDGQAFYINQAGCQLIGLDDPSLVEDTQMLDYIDTDYRSYFNNTVIPQVLGSGYWEGEIVFRHFKTQQHIDIEGNLFLIHHPQTREPICFATVSRDITERKRAARQQSYLAAIIEGTEDIAVIKDLDLRVIATNKAFAKAAGKNSVSEMIGKTDAEIFNVSPNSEPICSYMADERYAQTLPEGEKIIREEGVVCTDGQVRTVLTKKFPIFDSQGKVIATANISSDITERKEMEDALRKINEELESRVEERTKELKHAKDSAEAANLAKTTFLANMSHELRTPLNGILGYTQILSRDRQLSPHQREGINIIHRSGEYLLTLINDILDLSKIEVGRIELYPVDFNFKEFLMNIATLFEIRAEEKGISFMYEPTGNVPKGLRGDDKRLRQILINLLGNAVKFTQKGGIIFKVDYKNHHVRLDIEDTGVGIAEDELEKIFMPFQQAGDQNYRAEGTGLGLSITQRLVEKMNGEIQVHSQLNKGSHFTVFLPLPTSEIVKSQQEELIITGYRRKDGGIFRVLVVDDKWENRSVIVNLLTALGFQVLEAENGQIALNLTVKDKPDIILTDLVMPEMDGFEFARQLRHNPQWKDLPVIAVSASVFEHHQSRSLTAGCNAFVSKPIRMHELLQIMAQFLDIEWVYETQEEYEAHLQKDDEEISSQTDDETLNPQEHYLPASVAAELFELSMMGDIQAIINISEELELKEEKQMKLLASKLRELAKNFRVDEICDFVSAFMEEDHLRY